MPTANFQRSDEARHHGATSCDPRDGGTWQRSQHRRYDKARQGTTTDALQDFPG
jgi:hypothetical protein